MLSNFIILAEDSNGIGWTWILWILLGIVIGGIIGFFVTRSIMNKQFIKNNPFNEKKIRALYLSMGKKPSEADIKRTMNAIKNAK